MERWAGKVALVTGASDGVGKAIATRLLQSGMKVVGCGRRAEMLEKLKAEIGSLGELTTVQCDVSKEEQVIDMFSVIKAKYGGLDVCINNAGLGINAPILTGKSEDWQLILDVNVMGVLRVTREAVASMKHKGVEEGHIININSSTGRTVPPLPGIPLYAASKHALMAITAGTRNELLADKPGFKCRVSQISPARIDTALVVKHRGKEAAAKLFKEFKPLDTDDVAETVIFQLGLPPHVQVDDVIMRSVEQR